MNRQLNRLGPSHHEKNRSQVSTNQCTVRNDLSLPSTDELTEALAKVNFSSTRSTALGAAKCVVTTDLRTTRCGDRALYQEGLYDLGNGCYTWLTPNGCWGEVNSGLVVGKDGCLLIDTYWDYASTQRMMDGIASALPGSTVKWIVNTHADGDHSWGNGLITEAKVIAATSGADILHEINPRALQQLRALGGFLEVLDIGHSREVGRWVKAGITPYDFHGIRIPKAHISFEDSMELPLGNKSAQIFEFGAAHSQCDLGVYVPHSKILYSGDIVFNGVTPLSWQAPPSQLIQQLNRILEMDIALVVPGHGPVTDKLGVQIVKRYWELLDRYTQKSFAEGQSVVSAAENLLQSKEYRDEPFGAWLSPEYTATNIDTTYRHLRGICKPRSTWEWLLTARKMALLANKFPNSAPRGLRLHSTSSGARQEKTSEQLFQTERQRFLGKWTLDSLIVYGTFFGKLYPFGKKATGTLTYSDDGRMSVEFNATSLRAGELKEVGLISFASHCLVKGLMATHLIPKKFSYSGTFSISASSVEHHVEAGSLPRRIGKTMLRHYYFKDNELILTYSDFWGMRYELIWRKL